MAQKDIRTRGVTAVRLDLAKSLFSVAEAQLGAARGHSAWEKQISHLAAALLCAQGSAESFINGILLDTYDSKFADIENTGFENKLRHVHYLRTRHVPFPFGQSKTSREKAIRDPDYYTLPSSVAKWINRLNLQRNAVAHYRIGYELQPGQGLKRTVTIASVQQSLSALKRFMWPPPPAAFMRQFVRQMQDSYPPSTVPPGPWLLPDPSVFDAYAPIAGLEYLGRAKLDPAGWPSGSPASFEALALCS